MVAVKAVGNSGSWFARVRGEILPCIHRERIKHGIYTETYVVADEPKWIEFLDAIREGKRVIMTISEMENGEPRDRKGYVAVFRIEDYALKDSKMTFRIAERLQELK